MVAACGVIGGGWLKQGLRRGGAVGVVIGECEGVAWVVLCELLCWQQREAAMAVVLVA